MNIPGLRGMSPMMLLKQGVRDALDLVALAGGRVSDGGAVAVAVAVYYMAPDVEKSFRFITPGATLAVIVWIAASAGLNVTISHFANYNATYGSIGAIIVLLLYFFISSAVLLFGAQINAVIEHHSPQGKNPRQKSLLG